MDNKIRDQFHQEKEYYALSGHDGLLPLEVLIFFLGDNVSYTLKSKFLDKIEKFFAFQ